MLAAPKILPRLAPGDDSEYDLNACVPIPRHGWIDAIGPDAGIIEPVEDIIHPSDDAHIILVNLLFHSEVPNFLGGNESLRRIRVVGEAGSDECPHERDL